MTNDQELQLISAIPKLSELISQRGELSERELTCAGLPETSCKDNKTLIQRRTVFLTNNHVLQKELLKKQAKKGKESSSTKGVSKKRGRKPASKSVSQPSAKRQKIKDNSSDTENEYGESEDEE